MQKEEMNRLLFVPFAFVIYYNTLVFEDFIPHTNGFVIRFFIYRYNVTDTLLCFLKLCTEKEYLI
jgi:hypothetical protein